MKENADLKEKNQELEHVVQQLQFETETISLWFKFLKKGNEMPIIWKI